MTTQALQNSKTKATIITYQPVNSKRKETQQGHLKAVTESARDKQTSQLSIIENTS